MSLIDVLLDTIFVGFALIMLLVSFLSYRRHPNGKLALIFGSFLLFAFLSILVFLSTILNWSSTQMSADLVLINIGVLFLQYLSLVRS